MIIGVPKEIKQDEYRIALLPVGAALLRKAGHNVLVCKDAGIESSFSDKMYVVAGAEIVESNEEIYDRSELVIKVKEPVPDDIQFLKPQQILFCFFHFAASRELIESCLKSKVTAVAYETFRDSRGKLSLLTPMSEIAGRMSVQQGAKFLEKPTKGRGILLGGVPGVAPADVVILGGGVVGTNAARIAAGFGANVTILDVNLDRLRYLDEILPANVKGVFCDDSSLEHYLPRADLVIGAVLVPGARAPRLISRNMLGKMKNGAVFVDVSIDQGGSAETSKPTTHNQPTYIVNGVVHYCVTNIPGVVPATSTPALCNATFPIALQLADSGIDKFQLLSPGHEEAVNIKDGKITNEQVRNFYNNSK